MLHKKIRQLRIEQKLTQEDMAEALHISQNAYCLIEKGITRLIDYERIKLIAEKLEVTPGELNLFSAFGIVQDSNDRYTSYVQVLNADNHEMTIALQKELQTKNVQIEQLLEQIKQLLTRLLKTGPKNKKKGGGVIISKRQFYSSSALLASNSNLLL